MPRALLVAALLAAAPRLPAQAAPSSADVRDLPLVEVQAQAAPAGAARSAAARSFAVLITGDGDWASIDKGIAGAVAAGGVPVVGLKARAYLEGGKRTPDGLTRDIERVVRAYAARWGRERVLLLGFSRGADFLPFVVNRLAPDVRARVVLVGMYGAEQYASYEFHFVDLFTDKHRASDIPVAPELARMLAARPAVRAFCVFGADEKDSACRQAPDSPAFQKVERGGAHHFDKDYAGLGRLALDELARVESGRGAEAGR